MSDKDSEKIAPATASAATSAPAKPSILIGTSGYSFPDWVGPFYPPGTDRSRMLEYYVRHFPAVEVNATYYRIPPPSTLHAMERKTPPGFEFVIKAHNDMTHKRSLDPELYRAFARAVEPLRLEGKLHGILAQFPYAFRRTRENEAFLAEMRRRLPGEAPLFVEFRHKSWIAEDLFARLEDEGLGYVSVDEPDLPGLVPPVARATGDVGYVRLHGRNKENWWSPESMVKGSPGPRSGTTRRASDLGPLFAADAVPGPGPSGDRYDYLYSEVELKEWVEKIREMTVKVKKTFVFFNNCHVGQAASGAKLMRRLLEGEGLL
jgi:uncharacterized protein YecE (DUF72 family)